MAGYDVGDEYDVDTPWQAQVSGRIARGLLQGRPPTTGLRVIRWIILLFMGLTLAAVLAMVVASAFSG
jgi:hypothetical protein